MFTQYNPQLSEEALKLAKTTKEEAAVIDAGRELFLALDSYLEFIADTPDCPDQATDPEGYKVWQWHEDEYLGAALRSHALTYALAVDKLEITECVSIQHNIKEIAYGPKVSTARRCYQRRKEGWFVWLLPRGRSRHDYPYTTGMVSR